MKYGADKLETKRVLAGIRPQCFYMFYKHVFRHIIRLWYNILLATPPPDTWGDLERSQEVLGGYKRALYCFGSPREARRKPNPHGESGKMRKMRKMRKHLCFYSKKCEKIVSGMRKNAKKGIPVSSPPPKPVGRPGEALGSPGRLQKGPVLLWDPQGRPGEAQPPWRVWKNAKNAKKPVFLQ